MKIIFQKNFLLLAFITTVVVLSIASCQKDKSGSPEGKASSSPSPNLIRPDSGSGNTVLILEGSGLFDIRSVVFEKNNVPATFNPTLNTDKSFVFRVPDTAFGGTQKINFTNGAGVTFSIPFKVIALASVASASSYSFRAGEQITLTGNNLDDVTSVVFDGGVGTATIGAKTRKTLVITMPASTVVSTKLKITNASGVITTTQEFINADQAYVFYRDGYENGESNASWGADNATDNVSKISGANSLGFIFRKGNWHNYGFGWNWISQGPYLNLSFWMKGGLIDHDIYIFANSDGGPGNEQAYRAGSKIVLKASTWQYFKIPLSTLNLWANGTPANGNTINKLGWSIKGPDNADEKMNLDDVMFIK
jgi:hypothetical protein